MVCQWYCYHHYNGICPASANIVSGVEPTSRHQHKQNNVN